MSRKAKRTNELYFGPNDSIIFNELPEGYFYKNRFYVESKCFSVLLKDDEVKIHKFPNGTWDFHGTLFDSLHELYEWNEDKIAISYKELVLRYRKLGITHDPLNRTLYSYRRDDWNTLYDSKSEVLSNVMVETGLIERSEDREDRYLEDKTKEECIAYFAKPIKERIKLLEELL